MLDAAIPAIAATGDARAVPALVGLLSQPSVRTAAQAARSLGDLGDPTAITPLVDLMKRVQWFEAPYVAAVALSRLGWRPDVGTAPQEEAVFWIATRRWDDCVRLGAAAVGPILSWAGDFRVHDRSSSPNDFVSFREEDKAEVATTLRRIGAPAQDTLLAALRADAGNWNARPDVAMWAESLNHWPFGRRAPQPWLEIPAGLRDLREHDYSHLELLHQVAYEILSTMHEASFVDRLFPALSDPDPQVRWLTVQLLQEMPDRRAVRPIAAAFDRLPTALAVETLNAIGRPEATEVLLSQLPRCSGEVLTIVSEALARIGGAEVTTALAHQLQRTPRKDLATVANALGRIDTRDAREALAAHLRQGGIAVAAPLALAGDARGIDWLIEDVRKTHDGESAAALGEAYRHGTLTFDQKALIKRNGRLRVTWEEERLIGGYDDFGHVIGARSDGWTTKRGRLEDFL